jgi:PAS domain S-box-containing protein
MKQKMKILHLEDVPADAELVARELKKGKIDSEILVVDTKAEFEDALKTFSPNIILSDHSLASFDSHEALSLVKKAGITVPFVLVTATMNDEFAAKVMKDGASDYILKDRLNRLPSAVINSIEKQQLEEEQKVIHEKLVFHSEHTPLGFIEFDQQMRLKSISNKAKEIFGWDVNEHVSRNLNIYCVIYEEDWEWLNIVLNQLITGESTKNILRIRNLTKDGKIIWCEWFISVMKNGKEVTFMTLIHDVTENKLFEERLEDNDRTLKEAQSIAHIGNWSIDLLNKTEIWSDELYQILGVEKTAFPSTELFLSLIHPGDLKSFMAMLDKIENSSIDHRLLLKNGSVKYVFNKWRFEFNSENTPIRLYGILQDITVRKLAEIERIKLVSDLMLRNTELEQFAYIISHNLRAPVANIIGASSALEYTDLSEEEKGILSKGISTSVKKLDEVVTDLNHILQVKDELSGFKEMVNFSQLVNDIKASISNLVIDADVEIKSDFSAIEEYVTLKPYLYSIFYNLISNSVKYRRKDVHCIIEIKSRMVDDHIELSFKDNGMGINLKKNGEQVFGLYKRFHAGIEGKGMGLFMVKTQVETLGGKISIQSEENKGTEFLIKLEI